MNNILIIVKHALRISNDSFNDEIQDLIMACKLDLSTSGIEIIKDDDALTRRAIIVYCKAHFSSDNKDYNKLIRCYENLKIKMSILSRYKDE